MGMTFQKGDLISSNKTNTIGKIKKKLNWYKFNKPYKCIGRLNVRLLKEYVKHLKDDDIIGVYIDNNNELTPLHSRGWLCCPMRVNEEFRIKEFNETAKDLKMITIENL